MKIVIKLYASSSWLLYKFTAFRDSLNSARIFLIVSQIAELIKNFYKRVVWIKFHAVLAYHAQTSLNGLIGAVLLPLHQLKSFPLASCSYALENSLEFHQCTSLRTHVIYFILFLFSLVASFIAALRIRREHDIVLSDYTERLEHTAISIAILQTCQDNNNWRLHKIELVYAVTVRFLFN